MQAVSVVICAYTEKRWDALLRAVESVQKQSYPAAEIVVVIDHNPALFERAQAHFGGAIQLIENTEKQGLSGARNTGIAAAHGEVLAFMDEDAAAAENWLADLMKEYEDERVLGVGGAILPDWQSSRPRWFPEEFDWVVGCTYRGMPESKAPVRNLIGCNMSFRRVAFTIAGGFPDGIGRIGTRPLGCEETEFSIRAVQQFKGSQLLYQPQASVLHTVPAIRANLQYFMSRCFSEGQSKASISRMVGRTKSLASEWTYTRKTLPAGVVRGVKDAFTGDLTGLGRAGAIFLGLALTGIGFVHGSLFGKPVSPATRPEPVPAEFQPARVIDLEIGAPLPVIHSQDSQTGQTYRRAVCLVRLHTSPLAMLELQIPGESLAPEASAAQIWEALSVQINDHLKADGLPPIPELTAAGLPADKTPACQISQAQALAQAPLASVVVATHERLDTLIPVLDTLLEQDYPGPYEIILVDNAPRSNTTADYIHNRFGAGAGARVRYVRDDLPGLAVAHNRGLLEVKGEIVAFTDDDVLVDPSWLSRLAAPFMQDERVACVTGMILPVELETPAQGWVEQFGFSKGYARRVFDLKNNRAPGLLYPYTAGVFGSGANMAFRTAVLCRLGGFDPALGAGSPALGGDDLAAFFEIVAAGYRLVYEPGAFLYHRHRREYAGLLRQAFGYGVGLSAYLTKIVVDHPLRLFDLALKTPAGLIYLFSPKSTKNQKKHSDYPQELSTLERKGFFKGPFYYLRSRWRYRQARQVSVTLAKTPTQTTRPATPQVS